MNRRRNSPHPISGMRAEAMTWSLGEPQDVPAFSRGRRLRRQFLEYRSDFLLSGLLFVLLVWMGLVALTLWH